MIYKVFVAGVNGFRNFKVRRLRIQPAGLRVITLQNTIKRII